jgi:microcin-processing metallopeptidase PmbA/TldD-like protein
VTAIATSVRTPVEIAERALALAGPDMQVTVVRERSLLSRFARSAPTQATEVEDTSVEVLAVRDGHTAAATTNRLDDDALRATARAAELAALASARCGPGPYPGLAEPAAVRGHAGFDPDTARLDPTRAAGALREAFAVAGEHGLEAFGAWTVGAVRTAIASTSGLALGDEVTDAFMKVVCRDAGGRSGYAAATATAAAGLEDLRHPPVVREHGPREGDAVDRHDARRDVPHRGRPGLAAPARRALQGLRPAPAGRDRGAHELAAARDRGRVLRPPLRPRRRLPRAAGRRLPRHRRDRVTC